MLSGAKLRLERPDIRFIGSDHLGLHEPVPGRLAFAGLETGPARPQGISPAIRLINKQDITKLPGQGGFRRLADGFVSLRDFKSDCQMTTLNFVQAEKPVKPSPRLT